LRAVVVVALAFVGGVVFPGVATAAPVAWRQARAAAGEAGSFLACEVAGPGGIDGGLSNASTWAGLEEARAMDPSMRIRKLQSRSAGGLPREINRFIRDRCGVIVVVGFATGPATLAAARAHPREEFVTVDYGARQLVRNVDSLLYETNQGAFLGGFLAAAHSTTGKVGTFGAELTPTITSYMDGWVAGVCYFDHVDHKRVEVLGWIPERHRAKGSLAGHGTFTGSLTNRADGGTEATTLMQEGADVIFPVAGSSGLGAAAAVQQYGHGVTLEWADTDGCVSARRYCSLFLTSVTTGVAISVETVVLSAAFGKFTGNNYVGDLANGGVTLAPFHTSEKTIPARLRADLRMITSGIVSGRISVDPDAYPGICLR
jgi:basic membrane protein A